jgi:EmrB/QacA subfamily drug resistance transporter
MVGPGTDAYRRRWLTLVVLNLSLMVIGVDNTILNVALPTLVRDIHASTSDLQWLVDSYVLVFAGLLLTAGSLGDRFGRRGALTVGLAVFGSASAAAAFSSSVSELIAFRALMGAGAALIMPSTLSILTNVFTDPTERARAIGVWAGVSGVGIGLGPIVGGALLEHFWWGSVFLVNVPIAGSAIVLGRFLVPTSKDPSAPRLDPIGALLSMVGLSALLWAIIEAPTRGWGAPGTLGGFVVAAAVLGTFGWWELHNRQPMLDLSFFRNPRFTVASFSITLAFFAVNGALFLLTQMLQFVMRYGALAAGLRLAPLAIAVLVVAPLSPRLVERFGSKRMVAIGLTIASLSLVVLSTIGAHSGYVPVLIGLVAMAAGMSLSIAPATESIMGSVPREKAGVGSAVNDTTRQVGSALGVAVLGSILASAYRGRIASAVAAAGLTGHRLDSARQSVGGALASAAALGHDAGAALTRAADTAFVHGLHLSLLVAAVACFGGALLALSFLPARARRHEWDATEYLAVDLVVDPVQLQDSLAAEPAEPRP